MRNTIIVSVTQDRQLEFPPDIREKLVPGDEYVIWETDDLILFKKVSQNITFEELQEKVASLGKDESWMSEDEVCQVVKEVRNTRKEGNKCEL